MVSKVRYTLSSSSYLSHNITHNLPHFLVCLVTMMMTTATTGGGRPTNDDGSYDSEEEEGGSVNPGEDDTQRSNPSSDDESSSNNASDNSYESESDDSSESSRSSSSRRSSRRDSDSFSATSDGSHSSHHDSDQASGHVNSNTSTNYSNNRNFFRGVLPIVSHGWGVDQNCDPNNRNNNTLIQRRGRSAKDGNGVDPGDGKTVPQPSRAEPQYKPDDNDDRRSRRRRRNDHRSREDSYEWNNGAQTINCCFKYLCCQTKKRSTKILVIAFCVWVLSQLYYFFFWSLKEDIFDVLFWGGNNRRRRRGMSGRERKALLYQSDPFNRRDLYKQHSPENNMEQLREQRIQEARAALGTAAGDFDPTYYQRDSGGKPDKINNRRHRGNSRDSAGSSRTERLREGCSELEWHSYHFPNCNEIHEINLRHVVRRRSMSKYIGNSTGSLPEFPWGFVGNGLWRDVFSCDPREETVTTLSSLPRPPAVLKIMKSEHVSST